MAGTFMKAEGLNRTRSATVFLVNETTAGTIAAIPTGNDAFGLTTTPVIGQSGNYTDTSEIGAELISTDRVLNYMEYSTFDFEYYAKPSGGGSEETATGLATSAYKIANGGVKIAVSGDGATVTGGGTTTVVVDTTAGIGAHGLAVGDTVYVTGTSVSLAHGYFMVTDVPTANTFEYEATGNVTLAGETTAEILKVALDFSKSPEHDLLERTFGGVKFMSAGSVGSASGYFGGDTFNYLGTNYADIDKEDATVAQYYLKNTIQTFTVTSRQFTDSSVQMFTASGALPTNFSVSLAKDGPVTFSSSFQANRVYYGGTATITNGGLSFNALNGGTTDLTVTHPIRWYGQTPVADDVSWVQSATVGMTAKIMANGTVYPSGDTEYLIVRSVSGSTITVESAANAFTVPAESVADTTYLVPWLPTPCPDTGSILDQRKVQVYLTGAPASPEDTLELLDFNPGANEQHKLFHSENAIDVTAFSIDFDRSITTPALTEMTGDEYPPASYIINEPTISGSMTMLLRPKDFQYMNSLREDPKRCIGVRIGDKRGKIIEIAVYTAFLEIPTPADADGATQIDIPFTAVRGVECSDVDKFFVRYR